MTTLAPYFTLENMPCYAQASPADIAKLEDTIRTVLEPIRSQFGPVIVSSWKWWRNGCVERAGPHSGGGTVDIVTPNAPMPKVFAWVVGQVIAGHIPREWFGRFIYEPAIPGTQGEHIHISPKADMVAVDGISDSAAYVETADGSYSPVPGWSGTGQGPGKVYQLPGLTVTVSKTPPVWALAGFGLLFFLYLEHYLRTHPQPET